MDGSRQGSGKVQGGRRRKVVSRACQRDIPFEVNFMAQNQLYGPGCILRNA